MLNRDEIEAVTGRQTRDESGTTQPSADTAVEEVTAKPGLQTPLVLVIDDNDLVRKVVVEMVKAMNYRVAEAESGEVGLSLMRDLQPAVAIIDFVLPGFNGLEVAKAAREIDAELKIIVLSGYFDTVAHDTLSDAVSLRKPVGLDVLQRTIEKLLG